MVILRDLDGDVLVQVIEITGDVSHRQGGAADILQAELRGDQPILVGVVDAILIASHLGRAVVDHPGLGSEGIESRIGAEIGGEGLIVRKGDDTAVTAWLVAVELQFLSGTDQQLPSGVVDRGDSHQITHALRQGVVGEVGVVAGTHDDALGQVRGVDQGTVAIRRRLGKGAFVREHHVVQLDQAAQMVTGDDVGDGGLLGRDRLVVGQDHDVAVGLEAGELRQSVVQGIGHVLQIDADGVTDADTGSGIQIQLDGIARGAVLHERRLVQVTRLLVSGDDAINRSVLIEDSARLHGQEVTDGIDLADGQALDGRRRIVFLARGEQHTHQGKKSET